LFYRHAVHRFVDRQAITAFTVGPKRGRVILARGLDHRPRLVRPGKQPRGLLRQAGQARGNDDRFAQWLIRLAGDIQRVARTEQLQPLFDRRNGRSIVPGARVVAGRRLDIHPRGSFSHGHADRIDL
jgi:hypothetical protein